MLPSAWSQLWVKHKGRAEAGPATGGLPSTVLSLGYSHTSPHWAHGPSTQLAQVGLIGQRIQPLPATYLQCQTQAESPLPAGLSH